MFYDIRLVRLVVRERENVFGIDGEIGRLAGTTTKYIRRPQYITLADQQGVSWYRYKKYENCPTALYEDIAMYTRATRTTYGLTSQHSDNSFKETMNVKCECHIFRDIMEMC